MADTDLLTISEAAEALRTPLATLRYGRYLGTGPRGFRVGRRVFYRRGELEAWLDAQESAPAAASVR